MGTIIRPEISTKNKYWINKHRHYELKHFCLQYPEWKKAYALLNNPTTSTATIRDVPVSNLPTDPTARRAMLRILYSEKIDLIDNTARNADKYLYKYIIIGVTEGLSYTYLKARLKIPCSKDMYYDRYRKFFWLLNEARG